MKVSEINPFVRFAKSISYKNTASEVNVFDSRIFFVASGNAEITIDGNRFALSEGSLFYCASGSCYTILSDGCTINVLNFDLTQARCDVKMMSPYRIDSKGPIYSREVTLLDGGSLNSYIYIKDGDLLGSRVRDIIAEYGKEQPFFLEKCSAVLKELLIDIYRSESLIKSPALKTIEKISSYIQQNLGKKITNAELAYIAGYHEYHLNRIFLKHTGKTVHRYIIDARIDKAKQLLVTTDFTLSQIAESTGFNGCTHLCARFKSQLGISPSHYREHKRPTAI